MLKAAHLDYKREYGSDVSHYFLTGGYVFDLNYDLKFKPLYAKISFESSHHLTYQQILYKEQIELGATYRLQDSFGGMINFVVT
jgi:hypothetical protein